MLLKAFLWSAQPFDPSHPYFPLQINAHQLHTAADECNCHICVISYLYSVSCAGEWDGELRACLFTGWPNGGFHSSVNDDVCSCIYVSVFAMMCDVVSINFDICVKLMFSCYSVTSAAFSCNFLPFTSEGFCFRLHEYRKPSCFGNAWIILMESDHQKEGNKMDGALRWHSIEDFGGRWAKQRWFK